MVKSRKIIFLSTLTFSSVLFVMGLLMLGFINNTEDINIKIPGGKVISNVLNLDDYRNDEKEPFNLLLLGGDVSNSLTDTMIVLNYNPEYEKLSFLSIPRDTKIGFKGQDVKINSVYSRSGKDEKGLKNVLDSVEKLLGINLDYYLFIDTSAFRKIIDILGGIDYEVKVSMHYDDTVQNLHIHFEPGKYHFDGQEAEEFMRFRKPNYGFYSSDLLKYYDGSDLKRIDAQQNFISEVIKQKSNFKSVSKFKDLTEVIFENIDTNIEIEKVLNFSSDILNLGTENISFFKISGYDSIENGEWFFVYNYNIIDNFSGNLYSCDDILKYHFADSNYKIDNYDYVENNLDVLDEEMDEEIPKGSLESVESTESTELPRSSIPSYDEYYIENPSNNKTNIENMDNLY